MWANKQLAENHMLYDGVVGNPPFIRYQFLENEFQVQAELVFKQLKQKFTKHTNARVPFCSLRWRCLKRAGGLAW